MQDWTQNAAGPTIQAATMFFAALVGFGLQHQLDRPIDGAGYYPFFVVVLLFLRFLMGAANHLTYEHIFHGPPAKAWGFLLDVVFLTAYGLIGVFMCYADDAQRFLIFGGVFNGVALVWSGATVAQKKWWPGDSKPPFDFWIIIDFAHFAAFGFAWLSITWAARFAREPVQVVGQTIPQVWMWRLLLAASVVAFAVDIYAQLLLMLGKRGAHKQKSEQELRPGSDIDNPVQEGKAAPVVKGND